MNRSKVLVACVLLALVAFAQPASAQQFPAKPVRIVTPFSAGSGPDLVIRLVGDKLSRAWGQQVVIENRPGGSGFIAIGAVKKAPPDGYMLVQVDNAHMAAQPHLFKQLPHDIGRDFQPVAALFRTYFFVVVPASSSWKGMADLIAAAKANSGELTYGSWFVGSPGHLGAAFLEAATGIQMTHVPFKDLAQLYAAVGNNDVAWAFGTAASAGAMYRAEKVKFLAVAAPARIAGFAHVPTVGEAGGPVNFEVKGWTALLAPRGTPEPVIERVNADVARALAEPDSRERLAAFGFEPISPSPEAITKMIDADSRQYAAVINRAKISLD